MRGVALVEPHHDKWMAHNEDDFIWTTHHENDDMEDSLTYINICYSGVAQWTLTILYTCQSSSFTKTNLLSSI